MDQQTPSTQLSQQVEREVRTLIGDLHMQLIVLRSMLEMTQQQPATPPQRPKENPHPQPVEPRPEPQPVPQGPPPDLEPPLGAGPNGFRNGLHRPGEVAR